MLAHEGGVSGRGMAKLGEACMLRYVVLCGLLAIATGVLSQEAFVPARAGLTLEQAVALAFLGLGAYVMTHLKTSFFPDDLQYWSYVDVWLPNDATLSATNTVALQAEEVIRTVTED